jgi:hypothetical protein
MNKSAKKKFSPVKIYHPVSYVGMDEKNCVVEQQMGIALGVSQNKVLIETACIAKSKSLILTAIDHRSNSIDIKATVLYSKRSRSQKYITVVSFQGSHSENIKFAKKVIQAFYWQKSGVNK